jgi:hypothetical protein
VGFYGVVNEGSELRYVGVDCSGILWDGVVLLEGGDVLVKKRPLGAF